ncbi:MAG: hypothetical protein GXP11_07575 [Gammaproteobacteria bacterium]|nr:hypothetical protein [Gammaproteobacteria bacterium]
MADLPALTRIAIPADLRLIFLFVLMPGLLVWLLIYVKGARDDYYQCVRGQLLEKGFIMTILRQ